MVLWVVLDQLLSWWANSWFSNYTYHWLIPDLIRYGRADHGAPLMAFVPTNIGMIVVWLILSELYRQGMPNHIHSKLLKLPVLAWSATLITQTVDILSRGYAVNYVGIVIRSDYWWMIKITDATAEIGFIMGGVVAIQGVLQYAYERINSRSIFGRFGRRGVSRLNPQSQHPIIPGD